MRIALQLVSLFTAFILFSCSSTKKTSAATSGTTTTGKSGSGTYAHLFYKGKHSLLNDNTFELDSISIDETYGYSVDNPIMVGGDWDNAVKNERRFLNALLGPNGEAVTYTRLGSCCAFRTPHGVIGDAGLLDRYELKIDGAAKPVVLYVNMYDKGKLRAPKGFTYRK
jgi:hypothetical protein